MLHVCSTVAKPCCRTGSFLEGFFGMTWTDTDAPCTPLCAHVRNYNKCKKKKRKLLQQLESGLRGVEKGGGDQQLLTKTLYTTLNLIFCKIKHNND